MSITLLLKLNEKQRAVLEKKLEEDRRIVRTLGSLLLKTGHQDPHNERLEARCRIRIVARLLNRGEVPFTQPFQELIDKGVLETGIPVDIELFVRAFQEVERLNA